MKSLYISYDGMTDPLGGSQVLPYLEGLSARGHHIWLISCEKPSSDQHAWDRVRRICSESGIEWHSLTYHKQPPLASTMWDVAMMRRKAFALHRQVSFDLVHCRSYVPALVGLAMKKRKGLPFLFDMRGFWPEEKLEGGGWNRNALLRTVYRYFKTREREFFREADAIVSLTSAARDQMMARPGGKKPRVVPQVIPCCVDFAHFEPAGQASRLAARQQLGIDRGAAVLCYLGSLGGYYMLDEMLGFFAAYREVRPGARFLFITREPADPIRNAAVKHGIEGEELIVRAADRDGVPGLLAAADAGISFIWPTFSKTACSPTKLGEMMAMGMAVVVNAGVGDVDQLVRDTEGGIIVDRFDPDSLRGAAQRLNELAVEPELIRSRAERSLQLERGVESYDAIYRSIAPRPGTA